MTESGSDKHTSLSLRGEAFSCLEIVVAITSKMCLDYVFNIKKNNINRKMSSVIRFGTKNILGPSFT